MEPVTLTWLEVSLGVFVGAFFWGIVDECLIRPIFTRRKS